MSADATAHAIRESRDLMVAVTDQKSSPFAGRCGFCGAHCVGTACRCHRDLIALEQEQMRAVA